ncbi:helix-turn-helix domain-containing protein [Brevibacillus sp. SYSU BS000544]|uniref:helix-turn-helix domain-containing protein n=1 Tax=Brevibacillus sp. SYSU BS000544 TaxID=3416443 RepID=UPI003CE5A04B
MTQVGKRLREFRKSLQMTQEELASDICNRSYVSQIEKGQVIPSPEILEQLANRLNRDLSDLWQEAGNPSFTQVEVQNALRHIINRIEENEWDIARKWLTKLLHTTLSPTDQCRFSWAKAQIAEHDDPFSDIESLYLESIELAHDQQDIPSLVRSLDSLALYYCRNQHAEKAIPLLMECFQLMHQFFISYRSRISVHLHLGLMSEMLGEYRSAIAHLCRAEQMSIAADTMYKTGDIYFILGKCYMGLKEYAFAQQYFLRAINSISPNSAQFLLIYRNLAKLHRITSRFDQAKDYINKAFEYLDDRCLVQDRDDLYLESAHIHKECREFEKAREILQSLLESGSPKMAAEVHLHLADICQLEGEIEKALSYLQHEALSEVNEVHYYLGQIHTKNGNFETACKHFERYFYLQNTSNIRQEE